MNLRSEMRGAPEGSILVSPGLKVMMKHPNGEWRTIKDGRAVPNHIIEMVVNTTVNPWSIS